MLYSTLMLMMSSAFLMLRLTPGGSFPRPLSEAEERKYLDAWLQGDLEARNVLIERNLRLVAHIIKKDGHRRRILIPFEFQIGMDRRISDGFPGECFPLCCLALPRYDPEWL